MKKAQLSLRYLQNFCYWTLKKDSRYTLLIPKEDRAGFPEKGSNGVYRSISHVLAYRLSEQGQCAPATT